MLSFIGEKMLAWLDPDPDSLTQVNLDPIRIRVRILNTIVNTKFQGASLVLFLESGHQALPIPWNQQEGVSLNILTDSASILFRPALQRKTHLYIPR
jgi:hypothetical protein